MKKKAIVLKRNGKAYLCLPVQEIDLGEFISLRNEAEKNLAALIKEDDARRAEISRLWAEINDLKEEIAYLKGEDNGND